MSTLIQIITKELTRYGQNEDLCELINQFIKSGDPSLARSAKLVQDEWTYSHLANELLDQAPHDPDLIKVFQFFIQLAAAQPKQPLYSSLLSGLFEAFLDKKRENDHLLTGQVCDLISSDLPDLSPFLHHFLDERLPSPWDLSPASNPTPETPFRNRLNNLIWRGLDKTHAKNPEFFISEHKFLSVIARYRPELLKEWSKYCTRLDEWYLCPAWKTIVSNTKDLDSECLALCHQLERKNARQAFQLLFELNKARKDAHQEDVIRLAKHLRAQLNPNAIEVGATHYRDELLSNCLDSIRSIKSPWFEENYSSPGFTKLFEIAFENWDTNGEEVFTGLVRGMSNFSFLYQVRDKDIPLKPIAYGSFRAEFLRRAERQKGSELAELWDAAMQGYPMVFQNDAWELLSLKSKIIRNLAATTLASIKHPSILEKATEASRSRKADARLGAIELLKQLGKIAIPALKTTHAAEKSKVVQGIIEEALASLGEVITTTKELKLEDLLAQIESDKRIKLPATPWFDLTKFPLIQKDGTPLSEKAVTYLIQKQSKHKTIDAAPGILPVLDLLDREKNADSALALLNQWLDSDQVAKDRWALVLAGLLGDNRIIPALTPRIQPWCENSRHKLAEYAAQAISLLATEEALMILDTLANRYRSKFKNIGKACKAAFLAAAEARGVTPDELGDLVVPDLGFNSECHKEFDDGKIIAVLQPDFKITWLNPETEKETKSPPSNLSDEGKEELKTLRKILREAVKGQTARLEQMLVRQRRWPVARWQELFEEHPLLQSYAANLVWGIYDSNSELLRTFRRYPNGILAHGSGEMEDLEERDTQIGLVHPLELDDDTLAVWRDHLGRFKVKPPFPQLDRPVEILEENHANRREITFTENVQISGGTFLSRMNRRGWIRGSVIDAGGVTSYYKPFEGAGVEAILFLEEYWVGFDPVDSFPLGKALFATLSTVDRGSYIYDDPQPTDPRVLPFGKVPPIVFSEVIADLKALIEGQSKP